MIREKGVCRGCAPGTDAEAQAMLEWLKGIGLGCRVLDCAIKNQVDYCLRCHNLPCDLLYQAEHPYSKGFLDMFKVIKEVLKK